MKTAILTTLAALALAAPAAADPGDFIQPPDAGATLEPFHIFKTVGCIGEVAVFDHNGDRLPAVGPMPNGRNGFTFEDADGEPVYYDDDANQFVNHTHHPVRVGTWCSTVTEGSTVTPPAAQAPPAAPPAEPAVAPEEPQVVYLPAPAAEPVAPAPRVKPLKRKSAAKKYRVRRCHVRRVDGKRRVRCFTARVTRSHLTRAERKRLHLR